MAWPGGPVTAFLAAAFGVVMVGLGGYGHYRGRLSRSELTFVLVGAVALVAYAIEGASTFLSLPGAVSDLLAGLAGLAFVGLFLYWAYIRGDVASG